MARSPLFDIYDPDGELARRAELGMLDEERRKLTLADIMPEEEKSGLLNSLAKAGSSGLATAGWLLDTPGALVRGVLAGDPLSVFGSSERRVTGRELLRQYGMAGDEDTWGNFGSGIAAEVLLDPLTYLSGGLSLIGKGSLSQAGKAAQAAGLLRNEAIDSAARVNKLRKASNLTAYADAIPTPRVREYRRLATPQSLLDEIADPTLQKDAAARLAEQFKRFGVDPTEGLKSKVGVLDNARIPGTNIGFEIDGGGIGDSLARAFDVAGNWTKTAPVIGRATRTAAALFDPAVRDLSTVGSDLALTNELQFRKRAANAARIERQENARRAYSLLQYDARNAAVPDVIPSGPLAGQSTEKFRSFDSQELWNAIDDYVTSRPVGGQRSSGDAVADWVIENVPEFQAVAAKFSQLGPEALRDAARAGLALPMSKSRGVGAFMPRQLRRLLDPSQEAGQRFRNWGRDERAFSVADNFGRQRDPAYDLAGGNRAFRYLTGGIDPRIDSAALRQSLQNADMPTRRALIQKALDDLGAIDRQAFTFSGSTKPYDYVMSDLLASKRYLAAGPAEQATMRAAAQKTIDGYYDKLATLVQSADPQFAQKGIGIFDTPGWNNALRYEMGQAENLANAEQLVEMLAARSDKTAAAAVTGGQSIPLAQAAEQLGFDADNFRKLWMRRTSDDVTNYSIPESIVSAMKTLAPQTRFAPAEGALLRTVDQFTNAFKVGALASPAFHVRNLYSGLYNAATQAAFNPLDTWAALRASGGNYNALKQRLAKAPGYQNLTPDEAVRKFLGETGAQRVSSGNAISDISSTAEQASIDGLYTGSGRGVLKSVKDAAYQSGRSYLDALQDYTSLRGANLFGWLWNSKRSPRPYNTNPLLVLNDAVGGRVEDALRTGTFLNQVRKGVDPAVAGDLTRMLQVDYAPEAFTSFERTFAKRLAPFYSFQKGILPSIASNMIYRPGGLQGQTIRAVTRGTEPSEGNFVPDYLRHSAAIPLPDSWPSLLGGRQAPGLRRYLTNIDLPFESTLNLFTPGVGSTTGSWLADTVRKTGSNLAGQTNPLLKSIIEGITNRQLYTGRELSDLYSVLERDIGPLGRPLEQAVTNLVPFGARGIGLYRALTDSRLDPTDAKLKAAFNLLAGVKVTDVDEDRSRQIAARNMLDEILSSTPGVRTYENLTVPEDALKAMPEEQRRLYLLYRIIQADAAKAARERKKAEMDPMELLGAVR